MGLVDAQVGLNIARGYRQRTKENKAEAQADEDRARRIKREDSNDAFTQESRVQQRTQWDKSNKAADLSTEAAVMKNDETRQRIEDEGALELMYEIDSGVDPKQAIRRHNAKGRSRIDENTAQYDQQSKTLAIDMDEDGDGRVERHEINVPTMIEGLERITGRDKSRYITAADGALIYDTRKGKVVAENPKDTTGRAAADRPIKLGPNDTLVDPKGKVIRNPSRAGGGAGDPGITKFNPQTYSKDVTDALAKLVGGKFDPSTGQYDYAGATKKMRLLSRVAQGEAQRLIPYKGKVTADMIAAVVNDLGADFDPDAIRKGVADALDEKKSETTHEKGTMNGLFGLGKVKPDVLKDHQDRAVQEALVTLAGQVRGALDAELARGGEELPGGSDAEGEEATPDNEDAEDADGTATAADERPAVEWPAGAPPQKLFEGLQEGKARTFRRNGKESVWRLENGVPVRVK